MDSWNVPVPPSKLKTFHFGHNFTGNVLLLESLRLPWERLIRQKRKRFPSALPSQKAAVMRLKAFCVAYLWTFETHAHSIRNNTHRCHRSLFHQIEKDPPKQNQFISNFNPDSCFILLFAVYIDSEGNLNHFSQRSHEIFQQSGQRLEPTSRNMEGFLWHLRQRLSGPPRRLFMNIE